MYAAHSVGNSGMRETPVCFGKEWTAGVMADRNNRHMKILYWVMGVVQP